MRRFVLALSFVCTLPLFCQIRSGTIVGTVLDPAGAVIADAEILVRETGTNATYAFRTNEAGDFAVPYLPPGTYEVSARKPGFKTFIQSNISLTTSQTVRVDIRLEVGSVETRVEVTESALALQTESSRVTNAVSERVIRAIPNINNNPLNYAVLQQGVVARAAMNDTQSAQSFGIGTEGRRTFSNFQVNGGAAFGNDIQLDGVSIQASAWNEVAVLPNTEGIQEVKTTINNMSAEYGRSQGTVLITTKSGTNEFHGSAQFRLRNEALNANRFENNAFTPAVARPPFKVQNYSATFGGPILLPRVYNGKDRSFFFLSYEGLRFSQALDYFRTVPTALERRGNFSETVTQVGAQFVPVQVFDPFNVVTDGPGRFRRLPFPQSIIPASRLNPFSSRFVNEFPLPNRTPDDPRGINNFYNRMVRTFTRDAINARLDHRMRAHSLYGTFGSNLGLIDSPNGWGPGTRAYVQQGGFIGKVNGDRNYYGALGDTWTISPTLIADLRIGLTRVAADNRSETFSDMDYGQFGIPREFWPAAGLPGAYPEITSFGGGWSQISALNQTGYLAKIERQTNWNLNGSITKISGRWTHKWGAEFRNYLSNYSDARGSFWIRSGSSFTTGNVIGPQGQNLDTVTGERSGSGLASYLLGAGDIQAGENAVLLALSAKYFAAYQQSDWRVTNRLTVNLGLRYDIQPGPTERYNRASAISFRGQNPFGTPGRLVFPGQDGAGRNLYRTYFWDFGPRLGVAFRATDALVIRSGFGVTYNPSNTGYFGGPYYFGAQNFFPRTSDPVALQYGQSPAGALVNQFMNSTILNPLIGADPRAPQYYGSGVNEPRFDYEDMKSGKILQWNFFVERRLGRDFLAQVGYAGTRGYRLQMGRWNVNTDQELPDSLLQAWRQEYIATNGTNPAVRQVPNPFQPNPNQLIPFNGSLGTRSMSLRDTLLPYPFFPGNLVGAPIGFYTYNALMAQLQKSFSNGLLFNVHYTWSRTIEVWGSEAQNNNYGENAGLQTFAVDRRNLSNNYSISPNDIPHRVVGTFVWSPPVGSGRRLDFGNRFLNTVIGGWQTAGVLIAQSGQPQQGFGGTAGSLNGRGDRLSGVPIEVPKELQRWYTSANPAERTVTLPGGRQIVVCRYCFLKYNVEAFRGRVVQFPNGTFGPDIYWFGTADNRYGDIRGNGRFNINLSLQKEIAVRERLGLTFSAEASNLLNNTQFRPQLNAGLGNTFTNLSAAQIAQGLRPGMTQNDSFGTFGMSTFDPRQIELRLRIRF
ncbi:MAG: TonB-dependent receptor [Bryobacteraceae bacterium]|nr:TonB-dependent receptor [Bryobacteraceae bacterium]MDW8377819.1 TonB-dependent receptor [Bryobacterales bacterium]